MVKLSIVVPTYNVESFINECIDSLLNQTLDNIEILVINDGSTDKSIENLKGYPDNKIRIIHRENGGLSAARNTGLKYAQGEYIVFVDSDDFIIENNAYQNMYNLAIKNKSDIVVGNAIQYYTSERNFLLNSKFDENLGDLLDISTYLHYVLDCYSLFVPVWLYMFKREFLIKNGLEFKEGIYHEDEEFTPRALLKANNISLYNKEFYGYRQRYGSIMNSNLNLKKGLDVLETCGQLQQIYTQISDKKLRKKLLNYIGVLSTKQIIKYKMIQISLSERIRIYRNIKWGGYKLKTLGLVISPNLYCKIYSRVNRD